MRHFGTRFIVNRAYAVAAHDVTMAGVSFALALLLRHGFGSFWEMSSGFFVEGMLLFTGVSALVFWRTRIYRGVWRYTALRDVVLAVQAASLAVLIFVPILFALTRLEAYPRSALLINWFVLIALLVGPRVVYRAVLEGSLAGVLRRGGGAGRRIPVLLLGAGDNAELFISATMRGASASYRVVGIVDDDASKARRHIHGVRILGTTAELPEIVRALRARGAEPHRAVLTTPDADPDRLRALLAACEALGLPLSRLPELTDFRPGVAREIDVRPVRLEDLLGRPQAAPDRAAMRALVNGRRVCITGAGGTIGAELARQIAEDGPAHLTLVDNAEYNLYRIDMELDGAHPGLARSTVLGDVRDPGRLASTFARERPELVFHAAALKHVHMVETNPNEGVLTNALGTRNVADACLESGVGAMVLVSTDKAVNPASVMGATKRIAESYCQALAASPEAGALRLVTVRFGNVIGSSGSVVPLFQRQIAAGGPVTVTDPDVARYFMTTREAVQLLLQASALGAREEGGGIYVLDMGQPIRIVDLARQMIRLAGLAPDRDIEIVYTGLRPGEKKDEALFHPAEPLVATDTPGILRAQSRPADLALMRRRLDQLQAAARDRRTADALALVAALVPEYERSGGAPSAAPADAGLAR